MAQMNQPLSITFPAGCYIGFNAGIDRKGAEQLALVCGDAVKNGFKEIHLCISSPGGYMDNAYYVCNTLEALPAKIITHNIGIIQSAAIILFMIGEERLATEGSTFVFHQTGFEGAQGQRFIKTFLKDKLRDIQYDDTRSAAMIAQKVGQPIKTVRRWQDAEITMTTKTAVENGIVHRVTPLTIPQGAFYHQVVV